MPVLAQKLEASIGAGAKKPRTSPAGSVAGNGSAIAGEVGKERS